jgi:hypothetical protein
LQIFIEIITIIAHSFMYCTMYCMLTLLPVANTYVHITCRYGTTSYVWPPHVVLHSELINHDAALLRSAVASTEKPKVIVIAHEGMPVGAAEALLADSGLWLTK